jgi:hypothetical protein
MFHFLPSSDDQFDVNAIKGSAEPDFVVRIRVMEPITATYIDTS